jgi:hypothetical protein
MQKYILFPESSASTLPPPPPPFPPTALSPIAGLLTPQKQQEQHIESPSSDQVWRDYAQKITRFNQLNEHQMSGIPLFNYSTSAGGGGETEEGPPLSEENFVTKLTRGPHTPTSLIGPVVVHAIKTLPPSLRQKGQDFLQLLAQTLPARFTDRGEFIDPNSDRPIPDSNIIDLLHYLLRKRRLKFRPPGWSSFISMLQNEPAIPHEYIRRELLPGNIRSIKRQTLPIITEEQEEINPTAGSVTLPPRDVNEEPPINWSILEEEEQTQQPDPQEKKTTTTTEIPSVRQLRQGRKVTVKYQSGKGIRPTVTVIKKHRWTPWSTTTTRTKS